MGFSHYKELVETAKDQREDLALIRVNVTLMGKVLAGIIEADVVDEVSGEDMNTAELSIAPTLQAIDRVLMRLGYAE